MIAAISKIGPCTAVGIILGLIAIWWIEPTTAGGMSLLIVIGILVSIIGKSIGGLILKKKPNPENE